MDFRNSIIDGPFDIASSGSSVTATATKFLFADITSSDDPNSLLTASAAGGDTNDAVVASLAGSVAAATVPTFAYFEWDLKDVFGDALPSISQADILQIIAQLHDDYLPTDAIIGVALTLGGMAAPDQGVWAGLINVSGSLFAAHSTYVSSWAALSIASTAENLARAAHGQALQANGLSTLRFSCHPRDAANEVSRTNATATSPATAGAGGDWTKIAITFGAAGTGLASAADITAAAKLIALDLRELSGIDRYTLPTPSVSTPAAGNYNVMFIGHSMSVGTQADTDYGGNAIASGGIAGTWAVYDGGSTIATWPTGGPECSLMPYFLEYLEDEGVTGGSLVRSGTSGATLGSTAVSEGHLVQAFANFTTLGVEPDVVLIWYGANDAQTDEADLYLPRLRATVKIIRHQYPDAIIILLGERTDTPASYPELSEIEAHKATVASEFANVYTTSATSPSNIGMADGIHPSSNYGGGYDVTAQRAIAVLTAI